MPRPRVVQLLVAILACALVAAGCGSSKKTPTKAEFVRKGDLICAKANKAIEAKGRTLFGTSKQRPPEAKMRQFAKDVLLPSVQSQHDQIKDLGSPKGDEDKVKAILDAVQEGIDKGKKDPSVLLRQDSQGGPFAKADVLARDYGLKVCGQS